MIPQSSQALNEFAPKEKLDSGCNAIGIEFVQSINSLYPIQNVLLSCHVRLVSP